MKDRGKRGVALGILLLGALVVTTYFALRPRSEGQPLPSGTASVPSASEASPAASAPAPSATSPTEEAEAPNDAGATARDEAEPPASAPMPRSRQAALGEGPVRRAALAKAKPTASPREPEPAKAKTDAPDAGAAKAEVRERASEAAPVLVGQFMNRVGPQFRLIRVTCMLDGQSVYSGPGGNVVEVFRRSSSQGNHTLSIVAEYQGNGGGVFSYFDGYRFTVRGAHTFSAKAEGLTQVAVAAVERGGNLTAFQDRLGVVFSVR